jgi:O-acetylhomoserine/O-acetylserine sulfhydrylase-like pyridoxal-dependent enzyme
MEQTSYFDINQPETIEGLITPDTKFLQSPTNPAVDIIDLELLEILPKKHNLILIIDNCFATPAATTNGEHLVAFGYQINGWSRSIWAE